MCLSVQAEKLSVSILIPSFLPADFIKCLCGGNIFFKALELSSSIGFFQDLGGSDSPAEGLTDPSAH